MANSLYPNRLPIKLRAVAAQKTRIELLRIWATGPPTRKFMHSSEKTSNLCQPFQLDYEASTEGFYKTKNSLNIT